MKKLSLVFIFCFMVVHAMAQDIIYAGTNSLRGSKGIYVFKFDRNAHTFTELQTLPGGDSPNFLAIAPDKKTLYAVYSRGDNEQKSPSVASFRIETSGLLRKINEQSTEGAGPAHVSVDPKGRYVYVSNYGAGNISVFPLNKDGSLSNASDVKVHSGKSIVAGRQDGPHAHSAIPSANGRFLYVSDLGIDKIMIYRVGEDGKLFPAEEPFAQNTPGAGPRHFVIHPNGKFAYSAEELTSTVAVFTLNTTTGALKQIQRISMLPAGFTERNSAADIHFSPDGRFLYVSNRGHDSLVIYSVDAASGELKVIGHQSTGGKHPRNFMVDRNGEYILTANRDTDNVVVLAMDKKTGQLKATGKEITVPAVIALKQL